MKPSSPAVPSAVSLPLNITVFERGWLSANNILLTSSTEAVLVDTGYCTHAEQTLALVAHALRERGLSGLDGIVNTHLHSDHCGGNASLQAQYPAAVTAIPPGLASAVATWNDEKLGFSACGQSIVRFQFDRTLQPGTTVRLAGQEWEIHAAPGHDTHAVLLFEPSRRTLISGDALWQNGFGVVFPELDGESGFDEVGQTLDLIERLAPAVIIPGHGPVFADVATALDVARTRLGGFVQHPQRHLRHAAKVLLKYKLLEWVQVPHAHMMQWATATPLMRSLHAAAQGPSCLPEWVNDLLNDLIRAGAATRAGDTVLNA